MEKILKTNSNKAGEMPVNKMQEYLNMFAELKISLYNKCVALLKEKMPKAALRKYEQLCNNTPDNDLHLIVSLLQKADIADLYGVHYPAIVDCNKALGVVKYPVTVNDEYSYKLNRACADALCLRAGLVQKYLGLQDLTDAISILPMQEYYQQRSLILPDSVCIPELIKQDEDYANGIMPAIIKRQPTMKMGEVFKKVKRRLNAKYNKSWETHDPYFKFRFDIDYDLQKKLIEKYFGKNKWQASDFYLRMGIDYLDESRYTEANRYFSNSIKIKPDHHFVYWLRTEAKSLSGNIDGAVMDLLACFLLDPKTTFDNYIYALSDSEVDISFIQIYRWAEEIYFSSPRDEYWRGHPMISDIRRMDENDRLAAESYIISEHMDAGERRFAKDPGIVGFYNLLVKYGCENQFLMLRYVTVAIYSIGEIDVNDSTEKENRDKAKLQIAFLKDRSKIFAGINEEQLALKDLSKASQLEDALKKFPQDLVEVSANIVPEEREM